MGYTIPNAADAYATAQASPDSVDLTILSSGSGLTGVASGCAATVTGSDMVVSIAAGAVVIDGKDVAVAAGSATISAAHASLNRFDLITVNTSGAISATTGTPASNPVFPAIPANSVVLYSVYVVAAATVILSNRLTDKRVPVRLPDDLMSYLYF